MLDGGAVPPSEWPHRGWSMLKQRSRSMWSPNGNRCSQCRLCNLGTNRLRHTLRHSCGHTCCHRSGSPMLNSMLAVVKSSAGNRCSQCQFCNRRIHLLRHTVHRSYTHTSFHGRFHCSAGRPTWLECRCRCSISRWIISRCIIGRTFSAIGAVSADTTSREVGSWAAIVTISVRGVIARNSQQ